MNYMWIRTRTMIRQMQADQQKLNEKVEMLLEKQRNTASDMNRQYSELRGKMENALTAQEATNKEALSNLQCALEKLELLETNLSGVSREFTAITDNTQDMKNGIVKEVRTAKTQISKALRMVQEEENTVSENLVVMTRSIQEIIQNLTCLDEGNRIIIAKMLLQGVGE